MKNNWIDRKIQEPDLKLKWILVWGKCGKPHIAYNDYDDWNHTEACIDNDGHFSGDAIDFDFWQKIPNGPY